MNESTNNKVSGALPFSPFSLRDYMATHAPAAEIDSMIPHGVAECADLLGLSSAQDYIYSTHYPMLVSRARYAWADAMLRERDKR